MTCSRLPRNPDRPTAIARLPVLLASLGLLLLGACASTPPPTAQMAVSTAALAHAAGAGGNEWAPVEMRSARDKLDRARAEMSAEHHDRARSLAQKAQVDAQLAEAKAEAAKARKAAVEVQEAARVLSEEMARQPR
ncbi:uncharacterized protein DUF4398 [Sphaerotilus hippei]|uniref:Uncharacterized protein DUF4398 n=2 Tax=Sphaerotilus hippei TaxID=744406 RepID=A0A318GXW5_9BURK|nr:uncharacterized protein DUF4398 [Sphaerotilus hippei]